MPARDVVSWNAMMSGYVLADMWGEAFDLLQWVPKTFSKNIVPLPYFNLGLGVLVSTVGVAFAGGGGGFVRGGWRPRPPCSARLNVLSSSSSCAAVAIRSTCFKDSLAAIKIIKVYAEPDRTLNRNTSVSSQQAPVMPMNPKSKPNHFIGKLRLPSEPSIHAPIVNSIEEEPANELYKSANELYKSVDLSNFSILQYFPCALIS
ncbi:uncharacterized protein [Miscanthus floridulus]|uniref:uncharacterized protein n=1 Tax=Miscanthus floridulus TaxID=154761 RepID=UPI003458FD7F